ncbi:receptor kinase-like protein Xa21 isoform X2 [Panicum virgatum]|nr:receptor kinase-like protein Xa21 isoform X2 [Panicum virgatum]
MDPEGNDFKALIYKFMPRGDLYEVLYSNSTGHDENSSKLDYISLARRLSIMVDVSDALEYLHHSNQGSIVHSDVKPSNILLDENLTAHIRDLGLSRFNVDTAVSSLGGTNSTSSIAVRGTIGYVAPECAGGGQVSTATDVYSFGVVLLERFMRKRPTDGMFKDGLSIVRFAEMNFPDRVLEIVDPRLLQELHPDHGTSEAVKERGARCLVSALDIGLRCTKGIPERTNQHAGGGCKAVWNQDAYVRGN